MTTYTKLQAVDVIIRATNSRYGKFVVERKIDELSLLQVITVQQDPGDKRKLSISKDNVRIVINRLRNMPDATPVEELGDTVM